MRRRAQRVPCSEIKAIIDKWAKTFAGNLSREEVRSMLESLVEDSPTLPRLLERFWANVRDSKLRSAMYREIASELSRLTGNRIRSVYSQDFIGAKNEVCGEDFDIDSEFQKQVEEYLGISDLAMEVFGEKGGRGVKSACEELERIISRHAEKIAHSDMLGDVRSKIKAVYNASAIDSPKELVWAVIDSIEENADFGKHWENLMSDVYNWAKKYFEESEEDYCCPDEFVEYAIDDVCGITFSDMKSDLWGKVFELLPFDIFEVASEIITNNSKLAVLHVPSFKRRI